MSTRNIWVGNLPPSTNQVSLTELFSQFGIVESCKVMKRTKGYCGLVLLDSAASAAQAVAQLHNSPLQGQHLIVQFANNDVASPADLTQPSSSARPPTPGTNLWVGNLPAGHTEDEFRALCAPYGEITSLRLLKDRRSEARETAGMVNFSTEGEASQALAALDGFTLRAGAKPLVAKFASARGGLPNPLAAASLAGLQAAAGHLNTNVWVGNLPAAFTETDVRTVFETYGPVSSVKILRDKGTGRAEGAALVNFATTNGAVSAIQALNGVTLSDGSPPLIVRLAVRAPAAGVTAKAAAPASLLMRPMTSLFPSLLNPLLQASIPTNLWVGNLPANCTEADLQALFMGFGNLTSIKLLRDRPDRPGERAAMVNYTTPLEAAAAIQAVSGITLPGSSKPIIVKYAAKTFLGLTSPALLPPGASDNLWVGNVPPSYMEADIHALFGIYGIVQSCVVLKETSRQNGLRAAMVRFATLFEAAAALQGLNGQTVEADSLPLVVRFADGRKARATEAKPPATEP